MRHRHTLSHYKLLTGDMGKLYPIGLIEVLPGDTAQHSASVFLRFSPMAAPVMHPVSVRIHHFFVPHRLTWPTEGPIGARTGWEAFITAGADGNDAQTVPTQLTTGTGSDIMDYLGLPLVASVPVSSLPIRCFNMIFNEFYRDQDLGGERTEEKVDVPFIAWEKDYLTMARPWTQKGDDVSVPIGGAAPVVSTGDGRPIFKTATTSGVGLEGDGTTNDARWTITTSAEPIQWQDTKLEADLSGASAVPINEFRRAFALQRYAEARARYGSRYTEYLRYLGVTPGDARLDRPEYLGGGRARVAMSEVLQTTDTTNADPTRYGVGDMYGHGVASTKSNRYRKSFTEHGYIMSLLSVRPKAMYLDGTSRTWLRRTREDFWQKELQQIGQQEVWDGEVFPDPATTYDIFGYQDRYREYREEPSRVAGEFRDVLKYWHLGREFVSAPALNETFTDCNPSKRIFNVQTNHGLWIAVQHNLVMRRLVARNASSRIL